MDFELILRYLCNFILLTTNRLLEIYEDVFVEYLIFLRIRKIDWKYRFIGFTQNSRLNP